MGGLTRETTVGVPAGEVFSFVADPHNAPRYISSISRIESGPQGTPKEGQVWQAEANFLGRRSTVTLRLAALHTNELVKFSIEGEPQATLTLRLAAEGQNSTAVSLHLDAPTIPGVFLSGLMGNLLAGDMARLKELLEK